MLPEEVEDGGSLDHPLSATGPVTGVDRTLEHPTFVAYEEKVELLVQLLARTEVPEPDVSFSFFTSTSWWVS